MPVKIFHTQDTLPVLSKKGQILKRLSKLHAPVLTGVFFNKKAPSGFMDDIVSIMNLNWFGLYQEIETCWNFFSGNTGYFTDSL